jgi:hypothetical protein
MLPLAKPALATVAVFAFIWSWNDYMTPLLYLSKDPTKWTVPLGLAMFRTFMWQRTRWDLTHGRFDDDDHTHDRDLFPGAALLHPGDHGGWAEGLNCIVPRLARLYARTHQAGGQAIYACRLHLKVTNKRLNCIFHCHGWVTLQR